MLKTVEKRFNNGHLTSVVVIHHFDTAEEAASFREGWEFESRMKRCKTIRLNNYSDTEVMYRELHSVNN